MNQPPQLPPAGPPQAQAPVQPAQAMQAQKPVDPHAGTRAKYLAIVGGLAVVAVAIVTLYSISATRQALEGFSSAFQPQVSYKTLLSGTIGQLNNNPKLVVLTADIEAMVTHESTSTFVGIPVGSAKAEVKVPAKIQYYVPMKDLSLGDFTYDAQAKLLVVKIPPPILDTEVVDINSDPDKIQIRTEFGWSPLSIFKGAGVRAEAQRHLREAALEQGRHELLFDRAQKNAKEIVAQQMEKVSQALNDGVRLEVEFKKP
ncbi:MAG TPA: DUF4230 domain-containing protein [Planctomycetota bacterium]|nr:DUF4230 domain-containing protein [Planctomycetota bacterium]